jgi:hypothetical protein
LPITGIAAQPKHLVYEGFHPAVLSAGVAAFARGKRHQSRRTPEILQSAFDWNGEHLHRFLIHGAVYGIRYLGGIVFQEDARRVRLSRFGLHCGERFHYEYASRPIGHWTFGLRRLFPLIKIGLFRYTSAEAELHLRKTALERGITWSAWTATSISRHRRTRNYG